MGFGNRTELPRCDYAVGNGYETTTCDEPAVALWKWQIGRMYVCERHDLILQDTEGDE